MPALSVEITLLSDVVQTADSSTVGPHRSLDYLKGANLLGAAAASLYDRLGADAYTVFHSGHVRFLDAVPLTTGEVAAIPVPLGWFRRKGARYAAGGRLMPEEIHCLPHVRHEEIADLGLEGIRGGYFTALGGWFELSRRYRLKTAVDRALGGRPDPGSLFGYDALPEGSRWLARVILDEGVRAEVYDSLASVFDDQLLWLGRSRGAEYGRVAVRLLDTFAVRSGEPADGTGRVREATLMLESDLALEDAQTGEPTWSARPDHFALPASWRLRPLVV